jgi:hypothetical protein
MKKKVYKSDILYNLTKSKIFDFFSPFFFTLAGNSYKRCIHHSDQHIKECRFDNKKDKKHHLGKIAISHYVKIAQLKI